MNDTGSRQKLIRQVVRGEADVDQLQELGVQVVTEPDFALIIEPMELPPFHPRIADLAIGILALWARGGGEAQLWAKIVLGA